MAYPTTIDAFDVPSNPETVPLGEAGDSSPSRDHPLWHEDVGTVIVALQTKLGTAATSGVAGGLLFPDASGNLVQDDANLFYDDTNNRLHVGPRGGSPSTGVLNFYDGSGSGQLDSAGLIFSAAAIVGSTGGALNLRSSGTNRWQVAATNGHFIPFSSATYDIGTAANMVRDIRWSRQVLAPDGSVGTPSIAFTSETNTGLYFSSVMRFAQAGVLKMSLGSTALTLVDGFGLTFGTSTGSKIATGATQKLGFWNATPVVQPTAITDASGGAIIDAEARTALNGLLAKLRTIGIIAT